MHLFSSSSCLYLGLCCTEEECKIGWTSIHTKINIVSFDAFYTSHLLWLKYLAFLTFMLLLWRSWAQDLKCLAFNSQSYFHRHLDSRPQRFSSINRESLGISQERKTWTEFSKDNWRIIQNLSVSRLRSKHRNTNLIWYEHQLYSRGLSAFFVLFCRRCHRRY